ncbi:MAG: hypothetical protein Q4P08_04000, partial [Eubacteriales bacterium]|nr:hypothetical protein [Eubacteriales bacterium]
ETPGKPSETPGGDPSETPAEKPSEGETDPSQDESEAEQPEIVKEAEVDLGDSSDLDKEKKAELYLEIYLIDKEGKLKKVKVPYLITEGVAGQKYKFSAPELAGYELISDPLKELLEGALVEGRKQISVVYKAKDAKLSEAKINKLIAGLLDKDGNYLSTESEIPESKPTTGESEKETDKPSKPTKTPKPSKETKPSKESKPSKPEKTDPPSKPNYNYPQFNYPPYRPSRPIDMNFPSVGRPQGPKFTLPPVILPQQVQPQSSRDPVQLDPIDKASGPTVKPVDDKLINFSTQPGASAESERPQKTMKIEPQKERESDSKIFIFFGLLLGLGLAGVATAVVYFAGKKK